MVTETCEGCASVYIEEQRRTQSLLSWFSVSGGYDKGTDSGGIQMLNYEEELKKFKPSLEVEDIEEAVYQEDLSDMTDLLKQVMDQKK